MTVLYIEIDAHAADTLDALIANGLIQRGVVDRRDIRDITPAELAEHDWCHLFAGIGGWPHAFALADIVIPAGIRTWTASCPCQPFSAAGKGAGFADERHLWPALYWHISQCRPDIVVGEQVAGPAGLAWLDLVFSDLEALGYACGAVVFPAGGVGAPQRRERLYWGAVASGTGKGWGTCGAREPGILHDTEQPERQGAADGMAGADGGNASPERQQRGGEHGQQPENGGTCVLGHGNDARLEGRRVGRHGADQRIAWPASVAGEPLGSYWRGADWLYCRDGFYRPVEPRTFPLVDGLSFRLDARGPLKGKSRVSLLRQYGNAIVPQAAAEFLAAFFGSLTSG